jgi:predicted RNase H-like HicB family nuclease
VIVVRKRKHVRYTVILQQEPDPDFAGYYNASVPALPGCLSYGANREEALVNIKEAVQLYLEDLEASGEPIPAEHIEQVGIEV